MAAQSYSASAKIGDKVESEFASLCSHHNWFTSKISAGFGSSIPILMVNGKKVKAPDILLRKAPLDVAVEVKSKAPFMGQYMIDAHRVDYGIEWESFTQYPLLFVFKDKPYAEEDPNSFRVCSARKLHQNHLTYNPDSVDRNGNPCPTYLYDESLFVPFTSSFLTGLVTTKTDVSFYYEFDGEELRI